MLRAFLRSAPLLLGSGLSATALAAGGARCAITVEGAGSGWSEAASALTDAAMGSDCARIMIAGDGGEGATLTFITDDGRQAQRSLAHPDELAPALDALRERGPMAGVEPPAEAAPAIEPAQPATPAAPPKVAEPISPQADDAPGEGGTSAVFALQTGARSGSGLLSPVLIGSAALAIERWELSVLAAYEANYYDLEARVPGDRQTGALGLGVGAARREPIGSLALLGGVRTMIATLTHQVEEVRTSQMEEGKDSGEGAPMQEPPVPEPSVQEQSAFEWRLGAYVGLVAPRAGSLRFRAELGADLVGSERSTSVKAGSATQPPISPEWAITGLIGVELGGR